MTDVTLQPVAMITPTKEDIYAPSRIQQPKTIPYIEFLRKYADSPKLIKVSFDPDGKSNPQSITAYGFGYIV